MQAVVEALPAVAAVVALLLGTVAVFGARVVLLGRPADAPSVGRWTARAFVRSWWRWLRRARAARPAAPLARVIPIDAARRKRAAR